MNTENNKTNFWVQVQGRRNHTWQGKLTWIENNRVQYFRSALELLKLIDSAVEDAQLNEDAPPDDETVHDETENREEQEP